MPSVVQPWVSELTFMQQSVLFAAVRGPDGIHKNHIAKVLLRWYRRCVLIGAFEGKAFDGPYVEGGGSFTGPCVYPSKEKPDINLARDQYFKSLDELPHHFQLHLMHAAEILGYKHPDLEKRRWWHNFYQCAVADMHLRPELEAEMDERLGDSESAWRFREVVTAD